MAPKRAML